MSLAITQYPYIELQFNTDGTPDAKNDLDGSAAQFKQAGITDLFVISHGWNNDIDEARSLYHDIFDTHVSAVINTTRMAKQKIGVVGILWPSKKFDDASLIPGNGALALKSVTQPLAEKIDGLLGKFSAFDADTKLAQAKALLPLLEESPAAQKQFGELMIGIMRGAMLEQLNTPQNEDNASRVLSMHGDELLAALSSAPPTDGLVVRAGGALGSVGGAVLPQGGAMLPQGGAMGLGDIFHGVVDGVRNILNFATYYEMKNRAGIVGRGGVYQSVAALRAALSGVRLHFVGHSFGCRVVTAATDGQPGKQALMPHSVTLLQAAYSHYGFAQRWDGAHDGLFRGVIVGHRMQGPMIVTHTKNDKAVGIAYAVASRLANQVASAIGGPDDKYGGLGRNGALMTPEANNSYKLGASGTSYVFQANHIYNLLADDYITGHSDIRNAPVAYAMLEAAGTGL